MAEGAGEMRCGIPMELFAGLSLSVVCVGKHGEKWPWVFGGHGLVACMFLR